MKLHFKKTGEGKPFIILHGLFGSGDNWMSFARALAEKGFAVYQVDLRNHGRSPHATAHSLKLMSDDVFELINEQELKDVILLGHSMGGKAGMQLAIDHRNSLSSLIVVDIATHYYPVHHGDILKGLLSVNIEQLNSREQAEQQLALYIKENSSRQFLLKNLYRKANNQFDWRFNLPVLNEQIENIGRAIESDSPVDLKVLFVRGENSKYIDPKRFDECKEVFPKAELITIKNAGHWVHADQPQGLLDAVMRFLEKPKSLLALL